jgi:cytochrome c553
LRLLAATASLAMALLACDRASAESSEKRARLAEQGEALAQPCMTCHGTRGASTQQAVPTIGGQIENYLVFSLKEFRDDARPSTVMARIAKAYSSREIEALAIYFSRQPFARPLQETDPEKVVRGQEIHKRKCDRCHVHDGWDTTETESPLLAGQKLEYLRHNMDEILAGRRAVELKMDSALRQITPEEIDATLHFYAAQHGDLH